MGLRREANLTRRHHCAHCVCPASLTDRTDHTPSNTQAELAQTSDLVPRATYLSAPTPQSIGVASLLARPFWWGLSKVWGSGDGVDLGEGADDKEWARRKGDYVVPDLVEVRPLLRVSLSPPSPVPSGESRPPQKLALTCQGTHRKPPRPSSLSSPLCTRPPSRASTRFALSATSSAA